MDNLSIAAVSGLRSRMVSLDLLANNIANAGTSGYKNDREFYGVFASEDAENSVDGASGATLPVVESQWVDFSAGEMQVTGNPLDVAIVGKGFFTVSGPKGPLYTRNGSLKILPTGELANGDGYPLQSAGGGTIQVRPNAPITIASNGTVTQGGQPIGQIGVVDFKSTTSLRKMGSTSFDNQSTTNPPEPATNVEVQQGKLEGSNVSVPDATMRLIGLMRQFEMLQKAIGVSTDMDTKAIQEVARVSA
jgi:flagellar basal-body rod protein FlgF